MAATGAFDDMKIELVDGERRAVHVFSDPVLGDFADVRPVRFGAPLTVPGTDRAIMLQ